MKKPDLTKKITKQDIWAIGVIAYQLCTFKLPFNNQSSSGDMIDAIKKDPHPPIEQDFSEELKDLISCMLIKDPEHRPSI